MNHYKNISVVPKSDYLHFFLNCVYLCILTCWLRKW